jgi:hypothetical protein
MTATTRIDAPRGHGDAPTPHPDRWRILMVLCTSVVMIVVVRPAPSRPRIPCPEGLMRREIGWRARSSRGWMFGPEKGGGPHVSSSSSRTLEVVGR